MIFWQHTILWKGVICDCFMDNGKWSLFRLPSGTIFSILELRGFPSFLNAAADEPVATVRRCRYAAFFLRSLFRGILRPWIVPCDLIYISARRERAVRNCVPLCFLRQITSSEMFLKHPAPFFVQLGSLQLQFCPMGPGNELTNACVVGGNLSHSVIYRPG